MMQRNLDRRVEIAFPINDHSLKSELMNSLIKHSLKDNIKARMLKADMTYSINSNGKDKSEKSSCQDWLMKHADKLITKSGTN